MDALTFRTQFSPQGGHRAGPGNEKSEAAPVRNKASTASWSDWGGPCGIKTGAGSRRSSTLGCGHLDKAMVLDMAIGSVVPLEAESRPSAHDMGMAVLEVSANHPLLGWS